MDLYRTQVSIGRASMLRGEVMDIVRYRGGARTRQMSRLRSAVGHRETLQMGLDVPNANVDSIIVTPSNGQRLCLTTCGTRVIGPQGTNATRAA